jgi:nicotinate-nucleotide--dimethylbenzimidazole phosphoribosyltransferase
MTAKQANDAIEAGIGLVKGCAEQGYDILATGEMGIGKIRRRQAPWASVLLHRLWLR